MANPANKLLTRILIFSALSTATLMTVFEIVKQTFHAGITLWGSHLVTIAFTTAVSVLLTYYGLRRHHSLFRMLSDFITICAWCKRIRNEKGNWVSFEEYLGKHPGVEFSHGICSDCSSKLKGKLT